jgi:hypothetical protein
VDTDGSRTRINLIASEVHFQKCYWPKMFLVGVIILPSSTAFFRLFSQKSPSTRSTCFHRRYSMHTINNPGWPTRSSIYLTYSNLATTTPNSSLEMYISPESEAYSVIRNWWAASDSNREPRLCRSLALTVAPAAQFTRKTKPALYSRI